MKTLPSKLYLYTENWKISIFQFSANVIRSIQGWVISSLRLFIPLGHSPFLSGTLARHRLHRSCVDHKTSITRGYFPPIKESLSSCQELFLYKSRVIEVHTQSTKKSHRAHLLALDQRPKKILAVSPTSATKMILRPKARTRSSAAARPKW